MGIVAITWVYIGGLTGLLGLGFNRILKKCTNYSMETPEMYFLTGLVLLTVYAQIASLFGGLGLKTNLILVLVAVGLACWLKKEIIDIFNRFCKNRRALLNVLVIIIIGSFIAILTARAPLNYDTYLYHAQAIRWLEDYGVVPGLGNLHKRFAYNSSFLVLQALFSFKFLYGVSLHTVNGFIWTLFLSYVICSFKLFKNEKCLVTNALKFIILIYFYFNRRMISSPETDSFAMLLVLYIFIKWWENLERQENRIEPYGWLCLLGIFGCTLKLSAAFIVILLIKPVTEIIKGKQWKKFGCYVLCTCMIVFPFLIRNVIISGYVLYPYAQLDIVPFIDWKMDPNLVDYDRKEIMVWGRATYDVAKTYDWPFLKWFPVWYASINLKFIFICAVLSMVGMVVSSVYMFWKKEFDRILVWLTAIMCFIGWLFSAPLLRYGQVYMFILPALLGSYWMEKNRVLRVAEKIALCMAILSIVVKGGQQILPIPILSLAKYYDYIEMPCKEIAWEGMRLYIPLQGDQTGYAEFPAIPNEGTLHSIELRGNTLQSGFKRKD